MRNLFVVGFLLAASTAAGAKDLQCRIHPDKHA